MSCLQANELITETDCLSLARSSRSHAQTDVFFCLWAGLTRKPQFICYIYNIYLCARSVSAESFSYVEYQNKK